MIISAGSLDEAAALFSAYLGGRPSRIMVLDLDAARIYDETGKPTSGPYRRIAHRRLPAGVYGSPDPRRNARRLVTTAGGGVRFSTDLVGLDVDLDLEQEFAASDVEQIKTAVGARLTFLVVPTSPRTTRAQTHLAAEPEQLPELIRPRLEGGADLPAIEATVAGLAGWPMSAVGASSTFGVQLDIGEWVSAGLPSMAFRWEILRVRPDQSTEPGRLAAAIDAKAQRRRGGGELESLGFASDLSAMAARYERRVGSVAEQAGGLLGDHSDRQSAIERYIRTKAAIEILKLRAPLAVLGQTAHEFTAVIVGGESGPLRHTRNTQEIPWRQEGLYWIRLVASPVGEQEGKRHAATVAAAAVHVQDLAAVATGALTDRARAQRELDALLDAQRELDSMVKNLARDPGRTPAERKRTQDLLEHARETSAELAEQVIAAREQVSTANDVRKSLARDVASARKSYRRRSNDTRRMMSCKRCATGLTACSAARPPSSPPNPTPEPRRRWWVSSLI